jgi:5-methyltetrahydrofolate--homocysteine methyltransferase
MKGRQGRPTEGMTPEQRLHWRILHRHKEGVEADIDEILASRMAHPSTKRQSRSSTVLLPAMKEVGDRFGAGELILPFVLQSAEVMKKAVAHVEQFLERQEGTTKGLVVLATVYGDVHDIGKNLVKTILVQQRLFRGRPGQTGARRDDHLQSGRSAGGCHRLSALLVNTSKQMPLIVNELHRRGLKFPVLIGGAAINRRFGWRILYTEDGEPVRTGRFLLQRCLRRPGDDGRPDR